MKQQQQHKKNKKSPTTTTTTRTTTEPDYVMSLMSTYGTNNRDNGKETHRNWKGGGGSQVHFVHVSRGGSQPLLVLPCCG